MHKIWKYECRRLIWNKYFIGLLFINGLYAWYILTTDIVAGVAYTAPFSPWSFGAYLGKVLPISILTVFFLLTFFYSKKEKQVQVLTSAVPLSPIHFALIRSGAVAVCFILISTLLMGLGFCFYVSFFDYWNFAALLYPALLILPPCFVFALGIGLLAGRMHSGLLYALMLIALAVGLSGLSGAFDFFGAGYFSTYPMALPVVADGEPVFAVGAGFWIARGLYLAIGGLLFAIGIRASLRKARKA